MTGLRALGPRQSIAIAGGGLIGLSIAWRLAQAGFDVSLFDQSAIGGEASWAGAGMLALGGEFDPPSALAELFVESRREYKSFVEELRTASEAAIDYQECGGLDLAYDARQWEELQARAKRQATFGIDAKVLDPAKVAAFWPRVRIDGLAGALFYPDDAIVNPRDLVASLSSACQRSKVELQPNHRVARAQIMDRGVNLDIGSSTRRFSALVIAAGAWSSSIEVRNVPPPPLSEPVKGHLIGYRQPEQTCSTIIRHGHAYLLQRANGLLIAGASLERTGWDRSIQPAIAARLAEQASFVLPHLSETDPSEVWTGFRPASDNLQIGPWHSNRLFLAYGHYRNGILLAPATARRLVREISASLRMQ
ncbi:MAG: FAD-binding oxidoreductase [Acidobacteriota bacterium]|nr:FAD-binding oxidoreductase [Acidobacteriota bacterium]